MVKFGGVHNYIVGTWEAPDLEACADLNLPCADVTAFLPEPLDHSSGEAVYSGHDYLVGSLPQSAEPPPEQRRCVLLVLVLTLQWLASHCRSSLMGGHCLVLLCRLSSGCEPPWYRTSCSRAMPPILQVRGPGCCGQAIQQIALLCTGKQDPRMKK
jgi:hypothetical protein